MSLLLIIGDNGQPPAWIATLSGLAPVASSAVAIVALIIGARQNRATSEIARRTADIATQQAEAANKQAWVAFNKFRMELAAPRTALFEQISSGFGLAVRSIDHLVITQEGQPVEDNIGRKMIWDARVKAEFLFDEEVLSQITSVDHALEAMQNAQVENLRLRFCAGWTAAERKLRQENWQFAYKKAMEEQRKLLGLIRLRTWINDVEIGASEKNM